MGQPVLLPKFELPGDKPHWAIRAAWITGGLLLVSIIALGAVISHHRNLETQADIARSEALARVKAEADAKVAAIAAVAKAQREAELEAKVAARLAAQAIPATTVSSTSDGSDPSNLVPKPTKAGHSRRAHFSHGAKAMNTHSTGTGIMTASKSNGSRSASNKPDAIDELLRKMDKTK